MLESVIVVEVFHDILHTTMKDIAEFIDGVDFHILIFAETIDLGTIDIIVGIQIILRDASIFHCLP